MSEPEGHDLTTTTEIFQRAAGRLPWSRIAKYGGHLLATAVIGVGGYVSRGVLAPDAPVADPVQEQQMLRHWNWRVECHPIASAPEFGLEARHCPSDASLLVRVERAGSVRSFFIMPAPEPPPVILSEELGRGALDWLDPAVYAQSGSPCLSDGCLYAGDHGPPDAEPPIQYGDERPDGWLPVRFFWRDGCVLERYFHPSSGSWSSQACWLRCAGHQS